MTTNSTKPLYLLINKLNEHNEKSNGNKYLTLILSDKSKDTLKKYGELWSKIKVLIRSITSNKINSELNSLHNSENYVEK